MIALWWQKSGSLGLDSTETNKCGKTEMLRCVGLASDIWSEASGADMAARCRSYVVPPKRRRDLQGIGISSAHLRPLRIAYRREPGPDPP